MEQGTYFCFGCCRHDVFHDMAFNMNGPVWAWVVSRFILVAQVEISAYPRAGLGFTKVGGIAMRIEDHIGPVESNGSIWVGGCVVEEVDGRFHGLGGAF